MSDLQVYHKEIDSLYKNALFLDDVNELISFLATNNFEGVDYIDSKIAKDLSDLTLADEGRMHSLLDILLKVNETAGIFDLSDPNVLYDITFPVLKQLFNIIADENNNLVVLGKVVQLFSKFFSNTDLLNLIHATQSFEGSIQILGRKLPLIGDYISQLNLCECLFILSRSSTSEIWPRIWFSDPKIRSTFLNIDGANFDEDARKTLNVINRMEDNPRVFSYPVKSIMFGTIVLQRPGEDFWVDFNYDTESITFFFLYDEESFWETARVSRLNVNRYMFKDNKKGKTTELIITLNSPCYQIADSVSQNPITESNILTIVFHSVQKIKDHVENIFGSECGDSFPNKDRSSARSNVVPINKYMETDYSEFAQKTNHTGQRKASVCESVLNLETNEADESLSTSNKRKASVCESVLNLEANEADESLSTSNKRKASVCESVLNLEANEAEESVSTLNKRKASSVTIHLQSNKKVSTYLKGREVSNIADDECIPRSGSKNDFKPIFKKSSISRVNIVTVEESCISVEQADELEKHTDASLDQQKHVVIHTPSPTIQKLASEGKTNSLQEGLSASLPHSKFNDDQCSAVEKEISVNLEPDESALKQTNDSFDASNLSPTSEKKSFHFEKADGDSKNVGGENVKNLKVILESNNHPDVSQVGDSSSNKKSSQLLHRPSLSNDPLSNSELTDTAVSNKKKKKKIKKCNANDDVRRKSVEEIFDSHSDNNIDQKEVIKFQREDKPVFKATALNSKENGVRYCKRQKQLKISSPEIFSCPKTEENVKTSVQIDDSTLSRKNNSSKVTPKSCKKKISLFNPDRVPVYDSAPKSEKVQKRSILKTNNVLHQNQKKNLSMQDDDDDDFVIPKMKTRSYLKDHAIPNVRAEKEKSPEPKNLTLEKKDHLISEDLNTRRSALWARKKSKAMLDFENFTDDEQNFDIQYQPQSSRPNFTISSGKGPTPSKKRTSSLGKCPIPNEKRRSIFHTDTETVSSGHSWLKKKKKLFEPPKRKYSDRKKAIKAVSKIPNQAADVKENTVYDLNNCTRYELDQKNKNIKPKSNELKNKASYRNWSDIENNELFVEKIPSRSCLSKKISRSRLSADSNASVEHPMESAVFEHEEANKRLKYDSDIDFEQYIEDNENSNMKTSLKDSLSKNIPRDMDSDVHKGEKNISDPSRMKCKDSILSRTREEKLFQTPAKGRNSAVVSQPEEIKENEVTLPLKVPSGHQFDSEVEISNRPAKSSLEEFDVAFDEKRGKNMHLKYFLSSLTETSDLAENESGRDYTNNSKKRKSECFNASKRRKKLKIVADRKQKETKTLKHEVLQDGSGPENTTRVLNDKGRSSTKPNLKVKKNKICQDFEVPVDDILTFYESDENKSRIKECHVSSLNQTDTKEHEKRLKSTMKLHSKKIEASTEESDRITHPDIDNLNTKMFKRPSFSSSCSDHKKFKQMETLLSRLSECANYYSRKLIATFQICSRDYYLQSAKMRRHMLHVCECLSKTDDHLTTKDLKKMIKKCQLFRKKVEESLRKLVYLGQEYFEFENKCLLRMKNKNRRAGAKFCYYVAKSCKSASNLLEKKMLSKLNKLQKNFIHEIDGL